jgi:hypothetical protein
MQDRGEKGAWVALERFKHFRRLLDFSQYNLGELSRAYAVLFE